VNNKRQVLGTLWHIAVHEVTAQLALLVSNTTAGVWPTCSPRVYRPIAIITTYLLKSYLHHYNCL